MRRTVVAVRSSTAAELIQRAHAIRREVGAQIHGTVSEISRTICKSSGVSGDCNFDRWIICGISLMDIRILHFHNATSILGAIFGAKRDKVGVHYRLLCSAHANSWPCGQILCPGFIA